MHPVHEMASSTMETNQDHHAAPPPPPPLRCPRCDSANTKFCYYNNYSLSQPRHFCKACKRYWTRGGTLRNVPVGGGCRKNKRHLKRPSITTTNPPLPPPPPPTSSNPSGFQIVDPMNPLFYGNKQQSNPPPPPPPPPYDQLTSFPSNGLNYSTLFGGGGACHLDNNSAGTDAILSPTMATLLASTLNNKFSSNGAVKRTDSISVVDHQFQAVAAFDGLQMKSEQQGQQEWNFNGFANGNNNHSSGSHVAAAEGIGSDPQSVYWNALWHDPGSIGPSVTSLI